MRSEEGNGNHDGVNYYGLDIDCEEEVRHDCSFYFDGDKEDQRYLLIAS